MTASGSPTVAALPRGASYGLAIWLSTLGTDGRQRTEVSLALTERYAAAFDDLGTAAALTSIETT